MLMMMMEYVLGLSCLPLGVFVGAITERIFRRRRFIRLQNLAIKSIIAFSSVSLILMGCNYSSSIMRIATYVVGIIVGTALQPVGLTGGIATGKSTVAKLLQEDDVEHVVIIDLDRIAHDILLPRHLTTTGSVYDRLVSEFGREILTISDGDSASSSIALIDRRKLGEMVFADRQKRMKLNSITHPKIRKIMLMCVLMEGLGLSSSQSKEKSHAKQRVVCVDIPLLFEGGLLMRMLFGTIIVVACNPTLQLERLHSRNPDLTIEQCQQRIASQIPIEEKARKADMVIWNDGSLKSLKSQVRQVKKKVANIVTKQRDIELYWLVIGYAVALFIRTQIRNNYST